MLPVSVLRPWVLVAVGVLPQVLLLALNLQVWELAAGEMDASHRHAALVLFALELLSLLVPAGLAAWLLATKARFSRIQGVLPVVAGSLFLGGVFTLSSDAIPRALADWMLPPDRWMWNQFALAIPVMLFGALRLICPDKPDGSGQTGGWDRPVLVTLGLLGAPIGYLFAGGVTFGFLISLFPQSHLLAVLMPAGYIGLSMFAAAGVMRLCIGIYLWVRPKSLSKLAFLCFSVALFGPLAGLVLNAGIPFPADFQMPAIYALAALNGLVVLLPNFAPIFQQRAVWILQCLLFPFTVYFFAVFLPMLPLAPLGMMCFGLGAFIYVPNLLFLLHGYRILDGYQLAVRDGNRAIVLAAGIVAMLVWPVGITVSARMDRANLHSALDFLQYPDYGRDAKFSGRLGALQSALFHLRDFKEGLYLPFLSEYYNWTVFDNLVLPQDRLNATYEAFFGEPLPKSTGRPSMGMFSVRSNRRSVTEVLNGVEGTRPAANAIARRMEFKTLVDGDAIRSRLSLTLYNPTGTETEYQTLIGIPPGVLVTGLSLTIGKDNVAGRLFEKRAAMWVYQKITEVRPVPKDPAILRFVDPDTAELRVYPVGADEERHVEIEFLYPKGWAPAIRVGSETLLPETDSASAKSLVASTGDGSFSILLPGTVTKDLPSLKREPYLHFLVDCSKDSMFRDSAKLEEALVRTVRTFPSSKFARISFVNFETGSFQKGEMIPVEKVGAADDFVPPPSTFRGGFLPAPAIKQVLWQHHLEMAAGKEQALRGYPRIVVLRGSSTNPLSDPLPNLAEFARLLPDSPGYWTLNPNAEQPVFTGFHGESTEPDQVPVNIFQAGNVCFAAAAGKPVCYSSAQAASSVPQEIGVFQPATGKFAVPGHVETSTATYAGALEPWNLEMSRIFEPFQNRGNEPLKRLIALCRRTGTLVPSLAYMVVEDTAQWKMLERTEKKTLKGHEALGLSESTPEPGTIGLVLAAGLFLFTGAILRRRILSRRAG